MELLDVYDVNRNLTGKRIQRGKNKPGEYKLAVHVWIVNSKGELLLTLRSSEKETWANYWENTGGAVWAGESSIEGCIRELYEETGILANPEELELLASHCDNNWFADIYALKKDISISEIKLQPGETSAAIWVSIAEFEKMCNSKKVARPVIRRYKKIKNALERFCQMRGIIL